MIAQAVAFTNIASALAITTHLVACTPAMRGTEEGHRLLLASRALGRASMGAAYLVAQSFLPDPKEES